MIRILLICFEVFFSANLVEAQEMNRDTTVRVLADSISVDSSDYLKKVPQIPLKECDKVEHTKSEKYAIVYKANLCGIYDKEKKCNVTEINFLSLRVRNRAMTEVGPITVFIFTAGERKGLITLNEADNEMMMFVL